MSTSETVPPPGVPPHRAPEPTDGATRTAWYRHRTVLLWLAVVVVAGATVLVDLPSSASRASQISSDTGAMRAINGYVRSCAFAAGETFTIYHDEQQGDLTAAHRALVPRLLVDDQNACSFTNQDIVNLSQTELPSSTAGRDLQELVTTLLTWSTSDALQAIESVQRLTTSPHDRTALRRLAKAEQELRADHAKAFDELAAAGRVLRAHLPEPGIPALP